MNIEVGKCYRTRDGHKAQVFIQQKYNVIGAILKEDIWYACQWHNCGLKLLEGGPDDLIEPWRDPIKKKAICWVEFFEEERESENVIVSWLQIADISKTKSRRCNTRVLISVEQIPEDGQ